MAKKQVYGGIILICVAFLTTGCWDRKELEDHSIVLAVGIDMADIHKQCGLQHDLLAAGEIHKIEKLMAEEVKRNALYAFHTYQALKVDAVGFGATLKAHQPLMWEKVKDHWDDEVFPTVSLLVSVNVIIENIGEQK